MIRQRGVGTYDIKMEMHDLCVKLTRWRSLAVRTVYYVGQVICQAWPAHLSLQRRLSLRWVANLQFMYMRFEREQRSMIDKLDAGLIGAGDTDIRP